MIDELAKRHGVGAEVTAITERAMRGEIDFQESFRSRVALLADLPVAAMDAVSESVALNPGADRLIRGLKHFGYRTAIISGGFHYVGCKLRERLGIDYVYANELEIANDRFTGAVEGHIIDAERKAEILKELCQREHISLQQAIAIGDGANDLPMLSAAGLGRGLPRKTRRESICRARDLELWFGQLAVPYRLQRPRPEPGRPLTTLPGRVAQQLEDALCRCANCAPVEAPGEHRIPRVQHGLEHGKRQAAADAQSLGARFGELVNTCSGDHRGQHVDRLVNGVRDGANRIQRAQPRRVQDVRPGCLVGL